MALRSHAEGGQDGVALLHEQVADETLPMACWRSGANAW
jgi:hypothetical protein